MRKRLWALSVLFVPALVFAHHSFNATFNPREVVEIEGVLTKVIWRNPHVRLEVEVDGEVWDIETHSVSILSRMEVGPELIDVGEATYEADDVSDDQVFRLDATDAASAARHWPLMRTGCTVMFVI